MQHEQASVSCLPDRCLRHRRRASFAKCPYFLVFRHSGNRKWFAVIMDIPRKNLGLTDEGEIRVVNLKCDTRLIGSFRMEPGIFPGWHMNKSHWLSVALE